MEQRHLPLVIDEASWDRRARISDDLACPESLNGFAESVDRYEMNLSDRSGFCAGKGQKENENAHAAFL